MEEVHGRHHQLRQVAEEGAGLSALHRKREPRQDRHGVYWPGPRADDVHAGICRRAGLRQEKCEGEVIVLKVDMLVKPGSEEKCKELIRIMQDHSRKEAGCLLYIGHQSVEDPRRFFFYEQYADQAPLQFHPTPPTFNQYLTAGLATTLKK